MISMNPIMIRNNLSRSSSPAAPPTTNHSSTVDYFSIKPKLSLDINSQSDSNSTQSNNNEDTHSEQSDYNSYTHNQYYDSDDDEDDFDIRDQLLDPFDKITLSNCNEEYYSPLTPFDGQTTSPQDSIISSKSSNKSTTVVPSPQFQLTLPKLTTYSFLIVDDNIINLKILNRILLKLFPKCHIVQIQDSKLVKDLLHKQSFDSIFIDIEMPDVNGIDIAQFVRQDTKFDNMGMVAVTTRNSTQDLELFKQCGIDFTFHKPLNYSLDFMANSIDDIIITRKNKI
ncbi:hypothetical protein I503_05977 [Candida albicans SC5314]|uniref:Stress response regulator protein 1 n=2 Tax=Candida albicans TaxID=5476 RepID=SRR1_CANAL|nr:Srr1p [Candida albicans SC5314]Q59M56.2 RecName: Full=Stress response regulator protein 1 [Candida albicans SC5314]KGQ83150.1 hypothetical protein MEU_05908 [Candida albicans P37005]KGR06035.1 hypothetical protein MG9_05927 [Candida albicans P37037]KGU02655.1 hypothetical protein MEY_05864 [Candida albicans 19F]AOW31277.1 Srr1p [Candida albicans SC5314]KHC70432.1 hypothetical protein W5Q_06021 [Candida albicans SC5314]|eukprot:XP_710798.2 Srr1p [Candida albicans SC5314]